MSASAAAVDEAQHSLGVVESFQEQFSTTFDTCYTWNYGIFKEGLRNLYEKAKHNQWDAQTALDWSLDVDPEAENVPDMTTPLFGTHLWKKFTPAEVRKFRHEQLAWSLSQFLHGEQGALLASAQIVGAVPWMDGKYYAATQTMDEARHVEVYDKYLRDKLKKEYPINPNLKTLIDQILTDSRWDMKYLGMQIMVEGLAMAAFGYMEKMASEPLLKSLTQHVMRDEARHVAFGVLSLEGVYADLTEKELHERLEFTYEGCRLMRDRLYAVEVWQEMGLPVEETREIVMASETMREFQKMLFAKVVPNVKRLGLLTPWLREKFAELDILKFEHMEASA
jgi:hypothetical protein